MRNCPIGLGQPLAAFKAAMEAAPSGLVVDASIDNEVSPFDFTARLNSGVDYELRVGTSVNVFAECFGLFGIVHKTMHYSTIDINAISIEPGN